MSGRDLERALDNLAALLPTLEPGPLLRFIRPRNPMVLWRLLQLEDRTDSRLRLAQIRPAPFE